MYHLGDIFPYQECHVSFEWPPKKLEYEVIFTGKCLFVVSKGSEFHKKTVLAEFFLLSKVSQLFFQGLIEPKTNKDFLSLMIVYHVKFS